MTGKQGFWTSLPGILTGFAAVITALTGLYVAVYNFTPENTDDGQTADTAVITETINPTERSHQEQGLQAGQKTLQVKTEQSKTVKQINKTDLKAFPETGPLVICEDFPSVNRVDSLMSWSNHYHSNIINPRDYKPEYACDKAIGYRARAHCLQLDNAQIRQRLLETLGLCRKIGFEWHEVTTQ